jgi:hypothetical protein
MPKRTACVRRRGPRGGGDASSEDVSDGGMEPLGRGLEERRSVWTVSSRSARKGSKEALDKLRGRDGLKVVERKEVSPMELERSLTITARAGNSYRLLEERVLRTSQYQYQLPRISKSVFMEEISWTRSRRA